MPQMRHRYSKISEKDGVKMIQHSNEDWDEYYGMSDEDLDWYTTDHTDAEWEEKRRTELIRERHLKESDVDEYYYFDVAHHRFFPNEKLIERQEYLRKIAQKMKNLYEEALSLNVGDSFQRFFEEAISSIGVEVEEVDEEALRRDFPHLFRSEPDEDDLEYMEAMEGVPEPTAEEIEKSATHNERISFLYDRGLCIVNDDSAESYDVESAHFIDGIKYIASTLYYGGKGIGLFYDEYSEYQKYVPHDRHVEELLKTVAEYHVPLLLIYWERENKPIWEIYIDGKFVRQQPVMYSYKGYEYDKKMMSRMAELKDADIGSVQKALMELRTEAEEIYYPEESAIRVAEIEKKHAELAQIVAMMQQKYEQLGFVFSQVNTTDDGLDEMSHRSVCDALDSFADTIAPGLAAAAYEEKAKKVYPFYSDVAASSQRYLRTAVALEEHLTEDHYDICPLYFELCRVFENELDIRIFSEYISRLLSRQDYYATQWGGTEDHFKQIRNMLSRDGKHLDNLFIPEKVKVGALYMVNTDKDRASVFQTLLLDLLRENRFQISKLEKESEYFKNCEYVSNRNKFVHPDDKLKAEELHQALEKIKQQTRERMKWLIDATQTQK